MGDPQLRHHASTYLQAQTFQRLEQVLAKGPVVEVQVAPSSSVEELVPSMDRRNLSPSWKAHRRTCFVASGPASSFVAAGPWPDTACDVVGRDGRQAADRRRHL